MVLPRMPKRDFTTTQTPTEKLRSAINKARADYPILFPTLVVASIGMLSLLLLMSYDAFKEELKEPSAYPPNVESFLRLALHHTHVRPDPDAASEAYVHALNQAERVGMDPFSKEVLGIRIKLAECLEKFGRVKGAVGVLKGIAIECEEKVRDMDRKSVRNSRLALAENDMTTDQMADSEARKALLRQVIQCEVKAATLCTSDYIQDPKAAKDLLSRSMKLLVEESQDAKNKGFTAENGAGLSLDEIASILAQTADLYSTTDDAATAVQIYNMALDPLRQACNGRPSCREAQLLSNIAGTMAMALKAKDAKINGKPATRDSLKVARQTAMAYASQAAQVASAVPVPERDNVCVMGHLSAALNIAGMQLDNGEIDESVKTYSELLPALRQMGLQDMAQAAESGLKKCAEVKEGKQKSFWG